MKKYSPTLSRDGGLIPHIACSLELICTPSADIPASEWAPCLWGTLEPSFRVLSSPTAHKHSPVEPICKLTPPPQHSSAPPLASGVPLNRPTHSLLECISELCQPSASHFTHTHAHTHTHTHTVETRKRKEVSGSPETQRTSWGALTSLHCTQLPVFDYWLLWQPAPGSAVSQALRRWTLTLTFFCLCRHPHYFISARVRLISSSLSSFSMSSLPSNNHPFLSLSLSLALSLALPLFICFLLFFSLPCHLF